MWWRFSSAILKKEKLQLDFTSKICITCVYSRHGFWVRFEKGGRKISLLVGIEPETSCISSQHATIWQKIFRQRKVVRFLGTSSVLSAREQHKISTETYCYYYGWSPASALFCDRLAHMHSASCVHFLIRFLNSLFVFYLCLSLLILIAHLLIWHENYIRH